MADNTSQTKDGMDETLQDLQLDPEDLDAVAGGTCNTCYSSYEPENQEAFDQL
ncbi:MAG: hypothetical protein AAF481_16575 [Acidobacteriota bacterium]